MDNKFCFYVLEHNNVYSIKYKVVIFNGNDRDRIRRLCNHIPSGGESSDWTVTAWSIGSFLKEKLEL